MIVNENIVRMPRNAKGKLRTQVDGLRRVLIENEAARLFYENGYNATSIDEIAKELGVSKTVIYQYFNSKSELLESIIRDAIEAGGQFIDESADNNSESPTQLLIKFAQGLASATIETKYHVAIYFREANQLPPDRFKAIQSERRDLNHNVAQLIERGIQKGEFSVPDVDVAARSLTGMILWLFTWYKEDGRLEAKELESIFATLALQMVGVKINTLFQ